MRNKYALSAFRTAPKAFKLCEIILSPLTKKIKPKECFSVNTLSTTCAAAIETTKLKVPFSHEMFPIQKLSDSTVYLEFNIKANSITFEVEVCSQVFQEIPKKRCFAMQQMTANEYRNNTEWPTFGFVEEKLREFWSNSRRMGEDLGRLLSNFSMNKFRRRLYCKTRFIPCPPSWIRKQKYQNKIFPH